MTRHMIASPAMSGEARCQAHRILPFLISIEVALGRVRKAFNIYIILAFRAFSPKIWQQSKNTYSRSASNIENKAIHYEQRESRKCRQDLIKSLYIH